MRLPPPHIGWHVGKPPDVKRPFKGYFREVRLREGVPYYFRTAASSEVPADQFFPTFGRLFGLGPDDLMVINTRGGEDERGLFGYVSLCQKHHDQVVVGSGFSLSTLAGRVLSGTGRIFPDLGPRVTPRVSMEKAHAIVRNFVSRSVRAIAEGDIEVTSRLVYTSVHSAWTRGSWVLARRCMVGTTQSGPFEIIDVDARTGRVCNLIELSDEIWAEAFDLSGKSLYDGNISFTGEYDVDLNASRLQSTEADTLDMGGTNDIASATNIINSGKHFIDPTNPLGQGRHAGATAHWAAQRAIAYFADVFGWNGVDGAGGQVNLYLNQWDPDKEKRIIATSKTVQKQVIFGKDPAYPSLDMVAHEVAHIVVHHVVTTDPDNPGLVKAGENGALSESIADIFATLIEFHVTPNNADWTIGEDALPPFMRNLQHPTQYNWISEKHPEIYKDPVLWLEAGQVMPGTDEVITDNDVIHANCGVPNKWFYLFCEGQPAGPNTEEIVGVGRPLAARILWKMLIEKKVSASTQFAEFRALSEQAAMELCGEFSQPVYSTALAWYTRGVGLAPTLSDIRPYPGELDVDPWATIFRWQAGEGEKEWQIEIATNKAFTADLTPFTSGETEDSGGVTYGRIKVLLKPNTIYYWRVTATVGPAAEKMPRPVTSFKTDICKPKLISPLGCGDIHCVHPWDLEFSWHPVDVSEPSNHVGAPLSMTYEIQVTRKEIQGKPDWDDIDSLIVKKPDLDEPKLEHQNMPVSTKLWWRVRAALTPDNEGEWSEQYFTTDLPQAKLLSPKDYSSVDPWGIKLEWSEVEGAVSYLVEVTKVPDNVNFPNWLDSIISEHKAKEIPEDAPKTSTTVNLPGWLPGLLQYDWQVRVFGPENVEGEYEEGGPSKPFRFTTDGTGTRVHKIFPIVVPPPFCATSSSSVNLIWKAVKYAEAYRIEVWEMFISKDGYDIARIGNKLLDKKPIPAQPSIEEQTEEQTFELDPSTSTITFNHPYATGLIWGVQAIGPEGILGMPDEDIQLFLVKPHIPSLIDPYEEFAEGDEVILKWYSSFAHAGRFVLEYYENCVGSPTFVEPNVQGVSVGENQMPLVNVHPGTHCWRVRPHVYVYCGDGNDLWSEMGKIKYTVPPKQTGKCNEEIKWGTIYPETHYIQMNKNSGKFYFWYNAFKYKDTFQVYYEDQQLWDTGPVSGEKEIGPLEFSGATTLITVIIKPNSSDYPEDQGPTEWLFRVICPSNE